MYKLNNISVINAETIKIGKDTFRCNINNKVVVYITRMAESKKDIKIVFDEYTILKTDYGFSISLISDAIDAVVFNKNTQSCKYLNMLETIAHASNYAGINKKNVEKLSKSFIDIAAALEQSDMVIIYNDEAVENFVRRYIAMMQPALCEKAPVVIDRLPEKLIPYLDKLDVVEKVMNETSPANLAYQLEANMFEATISIEMLPLKTLQKLTKAVHNDEYIKLFENYVRSGKGTVDEIEQMFKWLTAIKKLYKKTAGYKPYEHSAYCMAELLQYGLSISEIMIKVSNNLMKNHSVVEVSGCSLLDQLADIMAYRKVNNISDFSIPENIVVEHERIASLCDIENKYVDEKFANAANAINRKYSDVINNIGFICPNYIRDIKSLRDRVNPLSKETLDLFLDGKIIIFAICNERGKFYDLPVFYFDGNGNISMIRDELNSDQMAAAKILWNKIKERKEKRKD